MFAYKIMPTMRDALFGIHVNSNALLLVFAPLGAVLFLCLQYITYSTFISTFYAIRIVSRSVYE
jgi:hypothetical protein